jgi:hypothetical protein
MPKRCLNHQHGTSRYKDYSESMLIHDDILSWKGFGGLLDLAAGQCRLRIFDLNKSDDQKITHLKPMVVVASDLPDAKNDLKKVSVRSCNSHIATQVVEKFQLDPNRMIFVEYYCESTYGDRNQHHIPAKFVAVDFIWHGTKALHPKWRTLEPNVVDLISPLIQN